MTYLNNNNPSINSTHHDDSINNDTEDLSSPPQSVTRSYEENDLADLRPPAIFKRGYIELSPYEPSSFGGLTLKKTKNGQRAKSGVSLEYPISSSKKTQSW
jgi:hypothetical protein